MWLQKETHSNDSLAFLNQRSVIDNEHTWNQTNKNDNTPGVQMLVVKIVSPDEIVLKPLNDNFGKYVLFIDDHGHYRLGDQLSVRWISYEGTFAFQLSMYVFDVTRFIPSVWRNYNATRPKLLLPFFKKITIKVDPIFFFRITEQINKAYADKKNRKTKRSDWAPNDLCTVFVEKFGNWYRGKIVKIDAENRTALVSIYSFVFGKKNYLHARVIYRFRFSLYTALSLRIRSGCSVVVGQNQRSSFEIYRIP